MTYGQPKAGQWVQPVRRGYKLACCDCSLVHRLDFRLIRRGSRRRRRHWIQFRVHRDPRATAAMRRGFAGIRFVRRHREVRRRRRR